MGTARLMRLVGRAAVAPLPALLLALLALPPGTAHAGSHADRFPLMVFWSDDTTRYAAFPVPGSLDSEGRPMRNGAFRRALDDVDVLAYAFLQVDGAGNVYFSAPQVDLSAGDRGGFCVHHPSSCPGVGKAETGSFDAFARLDNREHALRRVVSVGGAGSERSMVHALAHPERFVASARAVVSAFGLDGIDLDFEPDALFKGGEGKKIAAIVASLRSALGPTAFLSVEIPADWETLRSLECGASASCAHNLAALAANAYLALMGYAWHAPSYPGAALTANDSNLLSDPDSPLAAGFYPASDVRAIQYLAFRGVPADKILLGFPAFFTAYGGVSGEGAAYGLYQPFDRAKTERYDLGSLKGLGTYRKARALLGSGFVLHHLRVDRVVSAAYAYDPRSRRWMSFEDPVSVAAKARYVRTHHLGGMMMWEIGEDMPPASGVSLVGAAHDALAGGPGSSP